MFQVLKAPHYGAPFRFVQYSNVYSLDFSLITIKTFLSCVILSLAQLSARVLLIRLLLPFFFQVAEYLKVTVLFMKHYGMLMC